jgi:hypothetical protein
MAFLPALLIITGLILLANSYYALLSKRSGARLALRQVGQSLRRRNALIDRLESEYDRLIPSDDFRSKLQKFKQLSRTHYLRDEIQLEVENQIHQELDSIEVLNADRNSENRLLEEWRQAWKNFHQDWAKTASTYNEKAANYNAALKRFPSNWLAQLFHLNRLPVAQV